MSATIHAEQQDLLARSVTVNCSEQVECSKISLMHWIEQLRHQRKPLSLPFLNDDREHMPPWGSHRKSSNYYQQPNRPQPEERAISR